MSISRTSRKANKTVFELITMGSISDFLRSWYGDPDQQAIEVDPDIQMPDPLRDWYRLTSQWSVPISRHNHFLAPEDLRDEDGHLVFWVENQGAREWRVDPARENPIVYESYDVIDEWVPTGFPLSKFLAYVAVSEAVHGNHDALISLDMDKQSYESVASGFTPLDDPLWRYPKSDWCYMVAEGMLAYGGIDPPSDAPSDHYWIMVSASRPEALEHLPSHLFD